MQIDWRLKSFLFQIADTLPRALLYFAQKHISRAARREIKEISPTWGFHADHLKRNESRFVLEIGAGKDLVQNLFLSTAGLQQTIVDLNPMLDMRLVRQAEISLRRLLKNTTQQNINTIDDLRKYNITYLAPIDARRTPFSDQSFDAIISTNTLEHIDSDSLVEIFAECMRLLRPNGIVCAKIDYSDHYARTDHRIGNANFLRFTEEKWTRYNHRNHYQNRMRHYHYEELAHLAGFELVEERAFASHEVWPDDVRPELLTGHASDRMAAGLYVWRKPAIP